jgi:hypothetical protein
LPQRTIQIAQAAEAPSTLISAQKPIAADANTVISLPLSERSGRGPILALKPIATRITQHGQKVVPLVLPGTMRFGKQPAAARVCTGALRLSGLLPV